MNPGALNSLTIRMAWQQQPQHEHEHCPFVDCTFIIQLTMPCDSASRLISRAPSRETCFSQPSSMPRSAQVPITMQLPKRLAATAAESRHRHAALALPDGEHLELVEHHFELVGGQGHRMGVDRLADRQITHRRRRMLLLIVERIAGLVQRLEQLDEAAMPLGQRLGRVADQHHLEDAGHDGQQAINRGRSLLAAAAANDHPLLVGSADRESAGSDRRADARRGRGPRRIGPTADPDAAPRPPLPR